MVFEHGAMGLLIALLGATALNGLAHAEGRGALVDRREGLLLQDVIEARADFARKRGLDASEGTRADVGGRGSELAFGCADVRAPR